MASKEKKPSDEKPSYTKIFLEHSEQRQEARSRPCVHFITFGLEHGRTKVNESLPTVFAMNLSKHQPPPDHLCQKYTGLDREIVDSFFSHPVNEEAFQWGVEKLWEKTRHHSPRGACVAVLINCTAGMHRSVAMAERLAKEVRRWDGFSAQCLHLDLWKGMQKHAERAREDGNETSEGVLSRGRSRSREEVRRRSEAGTSKSRPRRAAAERNAASRSREAPFDTEKGLLGAGVPRGISQSRSREAAGRSRDRWTKAEIESTTPLGETPLHSTTQVVTRSTGEPYPLERETAGGSSVLMRQAGIKSIRPPERAPLYTVARVTTRSTGDPYLLEREIAGGAGEPWSKDGQRGRRLLEGAPLDRTSVLRRTGSVGHPRPQRQFEAAEVSAGPWKQSRDEEESRGLPKEKPLRKTSVTQVKSTYVWEPQPRRHETAGGPASP